jgi:hypothetical protein
MESSVRGPGIGASGNDTTVEMNESWLRNVFGSKSVSTSSETIGMLLDRLAAAVGEKRTDI